MAMTNFMVNDGLLTALRTEPRKDLDGHDTAALPFADL
jgi:hypothetical protein